MPVFYPMPLCFPHVFLCFPMFSIIYWTNLLTRCPVPVPIYLSVHCRNRSKMKVLGIGSKFYTIFMHRKTPGARRSPGGGPPGRQREARRGHPPPAPGGPLGPPGTGSRCLFAYKFTLDLKTEKPPSKFPETRQSAAEIKNPDSGGRSLCSGTLPGRGSAPGAIFIDGASSMMLREGSEEHTSELQSLRRISYAVFCLKK